MTLAAAGNEVFVGDRQGGLYVKMLGAQNTPTKGDGGVYNSGSISGSSVKLAAGGFVFAGGAE